MKIRKSSIMLSIVVFVIFCFCISYADEGPKVMKVKGIYLGMNLNDTKKILQKFMDKSMELGEIGGGVWAVISPTVGYAAVIRGDSENKLDYIAIMRPLVDAMFGVSGLPVKEFATEFVSAYKIPSMKPFNEGKESGWEFISAHGYKVRIFLNGQLDIEKIAKKADLKFD